MALSSVNSSTPGLLSNVNPIASSDFVTGGFAFMQDDELLASSATWGATTIPDTYDTLYYSLALRTAQVAAESSANFRANSSTANSVYSTTQWEATALSGFESGVSYMGRQNVPGNSGVVASAYYMGSHTLFNYGQNIVAMNPGYIAQGSYNLGSGEHSAIHSGSYKSTSTNVSDLEWVGSGGNILNGSWYRMYGIKN